MSLEVQQRAACLVGTWQASRSGCSVVLSLFLGDSVMRERARSLHLESDVLCARHHPLGVVRFFM